MRYRPSGPRHIPEPRPEPLSTSALRVRVNAIANEIIDSPREDWTPTVVDLVRLARHALSSGLASETGFILGARRALEDGDVSRALSCLRSALDPPRRAA
jgi:hypothetical protein